MSCRRICIIALALQTITKKNTKKLKKINLEVVQLMQFNKQGEQVGTEILK